MDDMLTFHHVCLLKRVLPFIRYKQKRLLGPEKQSRGIMSADYTSQLCSFLQLLLTGKQSLLAL